MVKYPIFGPTKTTQIALNTQRTCESTTGSDAEGVTPSPLATPHPISQWFEVEKTRPRSFTSGNT